MSENVIQKIRENVESAVLGKEQTVRLSVIALLAGGHVLLEDAPGLGKTSLARALAKTLGCKFTRLQFTPDLLPSDILGANIYRPNTGEFEFRPGPVFTNILLADEINRTTPRTQSALLEAMSEQQVSVEGSTMQLDQPFLVIATQNPFEFEGTYPLPEAQLDRFLLKILIDYPSQDAEREIVARWDAGFNSRALDQVEVHPLSDPAAIQHCRAEIKAMKTEPGIQKYIVEIVHRTRTHPTILYGASPRATQCLVLGGKARAVLLGRYHVDFDDIRAVAAPVMRHRLALNFQARTENVTVDHVINELVRSVPTPS